MAAPASAGPLACVLGASGFIGRHAVAVLLERGFRVRAAVRRASDLPEELAQSRAEVVEADVTDPASLARAVAGTAVVVNCAGVYRWWLPDPGEYARVNDEGAANVARACLAADGVERLVHVSTAMAYGYPKEKPFAEGSEAGPHAAEYPRSKRQGDLKVRSLTSGEGRLSVVTLLLGCVTGAGDTFAVGRPSAVYRDFMLGRIPMLVGPDTNYIYVHIRDVQQAVHAACTLPASQVAGQDFFIGNSKGMLTTRQYFELMSRATGRPCPSLCLNLRLGYWLACLLTWVSSHVTGREPVIPVDIMRTACWGSIEYDCSKSEELLGLRYTPIDVAVAEAVADVRQRLSGHGAQRPGGKTQ